MAKACELRTYYPSGVCSSEITVCIEGGTVKRVEFQGGCHGNTQGLSRLVAGMEVGEAVRRLKGIDCGGKGTSCPDQLARALEEFLRPSD